MIERTLSGVIEKISRSFPVLLLTGPRQVGKTTLLKHIAGTGRSYVTLDDLEQRALARNDPALFLQAHPAPLLIDEVQYAPSLFPYIKIHVDRGGNAGDFWLTGSQKFQIMAGVTESLAGRVAIVDLLGLSDRETRGAARSSTPFLPTSEWVGKARATAGEPSPLPRVFEKIWRGSYPKIVADPDTPWDIFYRSYLQTYIERDVRDVLSVRNDIAFYNFVRATAARTAQMLNYAALARDVEIDLKTAKSWLSVLRASGLVALVEPYHNNVTKRVVKTPKLYFLDTGLCSYLTGWSTPETLEAGAMNGAIFETYVFCEILKSYLHNGAYPSIYHYRDSDQSEIDLLIERDGALYPIEIKKTATPSLNATKHFAVLKHLKKTIGPGAVVCLRETDVPLSREVAAIPVGYL
ncbi:ATP-binding protein [Synergistaceae bacterium OttesenSCG-928-I11]|nr:ATP-binding protein [Synergistaceae bacterium OttesenSCG-928-I11]